MSWRAVAAWGARHRGIAAMIPVVLRSRIRGAFLPLAYQRESSRLAAEALFGGPVPMASSGPDRPGPRIGIVRDQLGYFSYNVRACIDLGLPFEVVDILDERWLGRLRQRQFHLLLVWPAADHSATKQLFDERLRVLSECIVARLVPRLDELWLLDSKRRVAYWLESHDVPMPRTWIFYDSDEASAFVRSAAYPMVFKTDMGAGASGVRIIQNRKQASALVRNAFGKGVRNLTASRYDRQINSILFQEYVPHEHEWRILRVGPHYLCRRKVRRGHFASGSGVISWQRPPIAMLDFVRGLTELGKFESMAVDLFEARAGDPRGPYLVNELQCLVGAIQCEGDVGEATGRWQWNGLAQWSFEEGYFYRNACANLRIEHALKRVGGSSGG